MQWSFNGAHIVEITDNVGEPLTTSLEAPMLRKLLVLSFVLFTGCSANVAESVTPTATTRVCGRHCSMIVYRWEHQTHQNRCENRLDSELNRCYSRKLACSDCTESSENLARRSD